VEITAAIRAKAYLRPVLQKRIGHSDIIEKRSVYAQPHCRETLALTTAARTSVLNHLGVSL
jgi:hypothetical protein